MKSIITVAIVGLAFGPSVALAQGTPNKPISAMPPVGATSHPPNVNSKAMTPPVGKQPGVSSSTVVPGAAYAHGTGEVGDSSESNGMPGSQGAGASATTQSGHASNE